MSKLRLGVNIDHVATVRNARGESYPDPVRAAEIALAAGADGITAHLREDRRHISDADIDALADITRKRGRPLNLEMAVTAEMEAIALAHRPHAACLVPERREEVTTEGGLDAAGQLPALRETVGKMKAAGIEVSLFIAPERAQVEASAASGAQFIELHTGSYAHAFQQKTERPVELERLVAAAEQAHALGLKVNAGHGLNTQNIPVLHQVPHLVELNIGHSIVSRAIVVGLTAAVKEMLEACKGYP